MFIIFILKLSFFNLLWKRGGVGGGGDSFFELCIFERGKNFLRLVFMGKKSNLWLSNIDQAVLGIYPKQTCTLKEGDTAYPFQRKIHALVVSLARKDRLLYTQWA